MGKARDVTRVEGLKKADGERLVLDIPSLRILEGATEAITGENGAGKPTLLRMLAFLEEPTSGSIFFRGECWNGIGGVRRRLRQEVTPVDQNPYLFQGSVSENLVFGLKVRGVPERNWPSRLDKYIEAMDLGRLLSRGQLRPWALAIRPGVLLLDEPADNVDAARLPWIERVRREVRAEGTSILFSTHQLAKAEGLADRVLRLSAGRLCGGNGG